MFICCNGNPKWTCALWSYTWNTESQCRWILFSQLNPRLAYQRCLTVCRRKTKALCRAAKPSVNLPWYSFYLSWCKIGDEISCMSAFMFEEHSNLWRTWTGSSSSRSDGRPTGFSRQLTGARSQKTRHILNIDATLRPSHASGMWLSCRCYPARELFVFRAFSHWLKSGSQSRHAERVLTTLWKNHDNNGRAGRWRLFLSPEQKSRTSRSRVQADAKWSYAALCTFHKTLCFS